MTTTTGVDPYRSQRKYDQSQKDEGLVRVTIWVPDTGREKLLSYAKTLRDKAANNDT